LRDYEAKLGAPLVVLERGRGARLAPIGERLVATQRSAAKRVARVLPGFAIDLPEAGGAQAKGGAKRLVIAASHDLALAAVRESLLLANRMALDVAFMGSLHALEQYAAGQVDVAGFHLPLEKRAARDLAPFRRLLSKRRDRFMHLVDREQGFMVPRGNPARIGRFSDVARKRLRFVNRQRGSGTRLLIDRLLAREGLEPTALAGYVNEEFTHAAVAATVASGAADVGFGLRAAAAERGLAFIPKVRERYYLVVRAAALAAPAIKTLIATLQGPEFLRIVDRLSGYRRPARALWVDLPFL
jgi:molybdate-binding protein